MKTWKKPAVSKASACEIGRDLTNEESIKTDGGGWDFIGVCIKGGIGGDWGTGEAIVTDAICYVVGWRF